MFHLRGTLVVVLLLAMTGCYPTGAPPVGINTLSVPFHKQIQSYYCVPASILMWMHYRYGINYTDSVQNDIWSQAESNGWADRVGSNPGVFPWAIPSLAQSRLGMSMYRTTYSPDDGRKAISDELYHINRGRPVIAEANYDTHAVLVVGTSWDQVDNALQSPNMYYMVVHDPDFWRAGDIGRNRVVYMNDWMTIVGITCQPPQQGKFGCMAITANEPGFRALAELGEFDNAGGTYYGEPNPPQVGRWKGDGNGGCYWDETDIGPDQCSPATGRWKVGGDGSCYWDPNDSGPDQCVPAPDADSIATHFGASLKHLLTRLFAKPSYRGSTAWRVDSGSPLGKRPSSRFGISGLQTGVSGDPKPRTKVNPPFPRAKTKEEVLANVLHSVKASRLFERSEFKRFAMPASVQARRVILISSDIKPSVPDYYLVYMEDAAGSPVAAAVISVDGILGEIVSLDKKTPSIEPPALDDVAARLSRRFGVVKADYYFAGNNLTPSGNRFRPLVRAETAAGTVYVTVDGDLFLRDTKRPHADSIDKETSDLAGKYPGAKWLVTSDGIIILSKMGRLE